MIIPVCFGTVFSPSTDIEVMTVQGRGLSLVRALIAPIVEEITHSTRTRLLPSRPVLGESVATLIYSRDAPN